VASSCLNRDSTAPLSLPLG
jgi:hypothetical protein